MGGIWAEFGQDLGWIWAGQAGHSLLPPPTKGVQTKKSKSIVNPEFQTLVIISLIPVDAAALGGICRWQGFNSE